MMGDVSAVVHGQTDGQDHVYGGDRVDGKPQEVSGAQHIHKRDHYSQRNDQRSTWVRDQNGDDDEDADRGQQQVAVQLLLDTLNCSMNMKSSECVVMLSDESVPIFRIEFIPM